MRTSSPVPIASASSSRGRRRPLRAQATLALLVGLSLPASACATSAQVAELEARLATLEGRASDSDQSLGQTIAEAEAAMETLEKRMADAEQILRANQANLGLQVQDIQDELAMVRGLAEDGANEGAALSGNLEELRAELDTRLSALEAKLNEATNIPEGKQPLFDEAERLLKRNDHRNARRLYRVYLSRYPGDKAEADVRFKIGLTLYSERDYRSALGEFYWIVQNAAESESIHDALYYSGLAFAKLGQCQKALAYFRVLSAPNSAAPERYQKQATKQVEVLEQDSGRICTDKAAPEGSESQKTSD